MNGAGKNKQSITNGGLMLLKKPVQRALPGFGEVREGSTGAVVTMLPRVWAVAAAEPAAAVEILPGPVAPSAEQGARPAVELAFYRKYTEALLRRYLKMSMEAGRVPSLLGRELFRGQVTSYRVHSFEDVVIFCHDVEACLAKLDAYDKDLIRRIALQDYTQAETAAVMGVCLRTMVTLYGKAVDRLTRLLLERRLMEPLKSCQ